MRKIIVLQFLSLDGVSQAPGGPKEDTSNSFRFGGWTFPYFDDAAGKLMDEQMRGEYDLLLGRKTYDIFSGYWPEHTEEWPQVNDITKYVVSKSLTNPTWQNTIVLPDIEAVKKLKNEGGKVLQVHGSSDLIQSLMEDDLVDEYWLKIFPVTLGEGKRLFGTGTTPASFSLIEHHVTPTGVIFASYKRAGNVKTGEFS